MEKNLQANKCAVRKEGERLLTRKNIMFIIYFQLTYFMQ